MELSQLKGVGQKTLALLIQKGIENVQDLLYFFPVSFEDRRAPLHVLSEGKGYLVATVVDKHFFTSRNRRDILTVKATTEGYIVEIIFFNSYYINRQLEFGKEYVFYGELTRTSNQLKMVHPSFTSLENMDQFIVIEPRYSFIKGISNEKIKSFVRQVMHMAPKEFLTDLDEEKMLPLDKAIEELHFPTSRENYKKALYRFVFHEFFLHQLRTYRGKTKNNEAYKIPKNALKDFQEKLSFELTVDQIKAMKDIEKDVTGTRQMVRLLQADVGVGKSVVAYYGLYMTLLAGKQGAYMAPTEILALEQYDKMRELLGEGVVYLSGSTKNKEEVYEEILSGKAKIVVGTHALLEDKVQFQNLSFVVTDEQHRFGVEQRNTLHQKGKNPNILMMSATPIPRTLTMILYAHVDLSTIVSKPKMRGKTKTMRLTPYHREEAYKRIDEEISKGHAAFIVYPFIHENETMEVKSLTEAVEQLKKRYGKKIGFIHGEMNQQERNEVMNKLREKKISLVAATTVIEVGIDIPHGTVMVIENAERFGISQLHQLRGRVGRSERNAYCYLISEKDSERLQLLVESSDGFYLASEDLRLRGPGEIRGERQHGISEFIKADIYRHSSILKEVDEYMKSHKKQLEQWKEQLKI